MSTQKIVNLGLLLTSGAVFLFLMNLVGMIWGMVGLPRMSDWIASPAVLISLILAGGGALYIRRHDAANRFLNEVAQELSKVTWPQQKETSISTGVSCVLVAICALILFLFDSLWGTVLRGLF